MISAPPEKKWAGTLPLPSQVKNRPWEQQQAGLGGTRAHTGLLQLGDVQQGPVLGAVQGLLQALQAHGELFLGCCRRATFQALPEPLCRGCSAAQQPVEGAEEGPAQSHTLLGFAMTAAGERGEVGPAHSLTPS